MNKLFCLGVVFLLIGFVGISQSRAYRLQVAAPTIEQEATSIWRTINDIEFLENYGYSISLPDDPLISALIEKSKAGGFGNEDFPTIYTLVERIYNPKNYEAALQKVNTQTTLLHNLITELDNVRKDWDWNFNMFEQYQVTFTLYGTGGSYDADEGRITMLTNNAGAFMGYENPANTITHEIVHIGIEHLIQKYQVSHSSKERAVDLFVLVMFGQKLTEYNVQNMGPPEIDERIAQKSDLSQLPDILQHLPKD